MRVDRSSNHKGIEAGVVTITIDGNMLKQATILGFLLTNNETEYEALLAGLRLAKEVLINRLAIYSNY